jgi:hypothetical protein
MAMTEAEWLAAEAPLAMMQFLRGKVSDRKLRLFAVACCRRHSHLLPDDPSCKLVDAAERFADGNVGKEELKAAWVVAWDAGMVDVRNGTWTPGGQAARQVARDAAASGAYEGAIEVAHAAASQSECQLFRCIFGNPFRPVTLNPAWRTSNVTALATAIYDDRAFDRLPILADALEDAGCDNSDLLSHCRQPGEHVRGCWVVDLVLGRE